MQLHFVICSLLILFFSWMLLHAAYHSKSATLIEGLEQSASASAPTPTPTAAAAAPNPSEVAFIKDQVATLVKTAQTLKTQMMKNEKDLQANTVNVEKVAQSQTETTSKLAEMKSAK